MNGKGRPEKLTDDLKRWIVTHQQGRKKKLKATAILADMRSHIEKQLQEENSKRESPWAESLLQSEVENKLPGLSAIQKFLKPVNAKLDEPSPLDTPWHLGTLKENPLPVEVISNVLAIKDWGEKHPDIFGNPHKPLTIRQAIWASRLHSVYKLLLAGKTKGMNKKMDVDKWLWEWSDAYAQYERICELSGTPPNTTALDRGLWSGGTPIAMGNAVDILNLTDSTITTAIEYSKKDGEK